LNLGDSYCAGQRKNGVADNAGGDRGLPTDRRNQASGVLKNKDLVGVPWRVAFALQEAGWWLRQDIIWAKPNCMPESVKDRCTKNHEYMFLFAKSEKYYFDNEAIKEKTVTKADKRKSAFTYADNEDWAKDKDASRISKAKGIADARVKDYDKRNKRSVWWVGPKPFPEAHFAVYPIELIEPCILAGSPVGGTVFDPFGGSGTTAMAAIKHGRKAILTELSEEYVALARRRINDFKAQQGLDKKNVEWL
jgi:DNA modification methylase